MSAHLIFMWFLFLIGLIYLAHLIAKYAERNGLSYTPIFLLGLVTSPIIQVIVTLIMESNVKRNSQTTTYGKNRKCPFCAEYIKKEAVICRFCNRDLPAYNESTKLPEIERERTVRYPKVCRKCGLRYPKDHSICSDCDLYLEIA